MCIASEKIVSAFERISSEQFSSSINSQLMRIEVSGPLMSWQSLFACFSFAIDGFPKVGCERISGLMAMGIIDFQVHYAFVLTFELLASTHSEARFKTLDRPSLIRIKFCTSWIITLNRRI